MKRHWKLLPATLLLVFVLAFTACGDSNGNDDGGEPAQAGVAEAGTVTDPVAADTPPERDLGGFEINIANWWTDDCTDTVEADTASLRARWDDRREMEERYNFRMRYVRYGSWHDVRDDLQQQLLAMDRNFQVWVVEPPWFATNQAQNLFAPIPNEFFDDEFGINWNRSVQELTMRDGNPHGFASEVGMTGGVYFNMRLLEEVGLPRDLPFTLQASGDWTWETFTDMARHLSVDHDGDGIIDTWAITSFHQEMFAHALASNGAAYAVVDPATGLFVNATTTDAFRDAVEWLVQLREEQLAMHEDDVGGEWDAFVDMFNSGQGAIRVAANYVAGNLTLVDDFGFVAFPRGPRITTPFTHYAWITSNINIIPHFYSPEEVDKIMFAMQRWIRPLPDDDPDDWIIDQLANHRDERSVFETMVNFTRNPDLQVVASHMMMPAAVTNEINPNFAWRLWADNEASVIIEEAQLVWQALLDDLNDMQR